MWTKPIKTWLKLSSPLISQQITFSLLIGKEFTKSSTFVYRDITIMFWLIKLIAEKS